MNNLYKYLFNVLEIFIIYDKIISYNNDIITFVIFEH